MKKFIVAALACAMMISSVVASNATEFKASGQFDLTAENVTDGTRDGQSTEDGVDVWERFRSQIDIIASENAKGVLYFEIGDMLWGKGESADLGTDGINIETRRAYIEFMIPNAPIQVTAGLQGLSLPAAVDLSPVFNDDVAAVVASMAINENLAATAFFARPYRDNTVEKLGHGELKFDTEVEHEADMYGAIVSGEFGAVSVMPYGVFAQGKIGADDMKAFWLGAAVTANPIENLSINADVIYGNMEIDKDGGDTDANGFFLAGSVAYALDMVTPKVTGWWSEGIDDADDLGFFGYAGWFAPTTLGFDGGTGRSGCDVVSATGRGTTGVAISLEEISFIESVTHKFVAAYFESTDDNDFQTFDNGYEFDFVTEYQIYEALSATLELAYLDVDVDGKDADYDMFKTAVSLKYAF